MTEQPPVETNPPPAAAPPPEPAKPPVVIAAQPQNPNISDALTQMAQTVAAMPERLVDALRESTPAKPPEQSTTATTGTTAPAAETAPVTPELTARQRFHRLWFGNRG